MRYAATINFETMAEAPTGSDEAEPAPVAPSSPSEARDLLSLVTLKTRLDHVLGLVTVGFPNHPTPLLREFVASHEGVEVGRATGPHLCELPTSTLARFFDLFERSEGPLPEEPVVFMGAHQIFDNEIPILLAGAGTDEAKKGRLFLVAWCSPFQEDQTNWYDRWLAYDDDGNPGVFGEDPSASEVAALLLCSVRDATLILCKYFEASFVRSRRPLEGVLKLFPDRDEAQALYDGARVGISVEGRIESLAGAPAYDTISWASHVENQRARWRAEAILIQERPRASRDPQLPSRAKRHKVRSAHEGDDGLVKGCS